MEEMTEVSVAEGGTEVDGEGGELVVGEEQLPEAREASETVGKPDEAVVPQPQEGELGNVRETIGQLRLNARRDRTE